MAKIWVYNLDCDDDIELGKEVIKNVYFCRN